MRYLIRSGAALLAAGALSLFTPAQDVVLRWNHAALDSIRTDGTPPPAAARNLAILHAALHDALNAIHPRYEQYLVKPNVPGPTSGEAAVSTAAHDVLVALHPAQKAKCDALHDSILATIPDGTPKSNGISWGAETAKQLLAARKGDGSDNPGTYAGSNEPGKWRPHKSFGGIVRPALLPNWGKVTTFAVPRADWVRPPAPPNLRSIEYALETWQVQLLGRKDSKLRTPDQTQIAKFWGYGPKTATPPGHWNEIAQELAKSQHNELHENARMFALLNFALADSAIVCWDCKYVYGLWRPITAIPLGHTDGNPFTLREDGWEPLLETPPFPEYTSGHSTFSGSAAAVLGAFFGKLVPFSVGSDDLPGIKRSYAHVYDAAWESGMSRIYGGIHYLSGNYQGLYTGFVTGIYVQQHYLRPLRS